jgi:hypothetical protein
MVESPEGSPKGSPVLKVRVFSVSLCLCLCVPLDMDRLLTPLTQGVKFASPASNDSPPRRFSDSSPPLRLPMSDTVASGVHVRAGIGLTVTAI